jgi:hypothetical protein
MILQTAMQNVDTGVNNSMVGFVLVLVLIKRIRKNGAYLKNGKQAIMERHQID